MTIEGPGATYLVIAAMALATYVTRIAGYWLMSHIPPSPRLRRAFDALPASIILSTLVPVAWHGGPAALAALAIAGAAMLVIRHEAVALIAGLLAAIAARAAGL